MDQVVHRLVWVLVYQVDQTTIPGGRAALHLAAALGHAEVARVLVEAAGSRFS